MARKFASSHRHVQSEASNQWTITHGLNCQPSVTVVVEYEGVMQEMLPKEISYPDNSTVVIGFSQPYVGNARLV